MEIFKRRETSVVITSGIKVGILSLIGKYQSWITNQDVNKRKKAIDEMLLDSISFIGDNKKISMSDIKKLLNMDRKFLLFALRQFSTKQEPSFVFDYEFPVKNGLKRKKRFVVTFDKESFPVKPYHWVESEMIKNFKVENGISDEDVLSEEDKIKALEMDYPEMYINYDDIISEQKNNQYKLEESGITVEYDLLSVEKENEIGNKNQEHLTSHTYISMRNARYKDEEESTRKGKDIYFPLPLDKLDLLDIDGLRGDMMKKEAMVETSVVVDYDGDPSSVTQIDLISTPAFFFPKLAL